MDLCDAQLEIGFGEIAVGGCLVPIGENVRISQVERRHRQD